MFKWIKKHLPGSIKTALKKGYYYGSRYYCNICNSPLRCFLPGGIEAEAINKLEIVGAGFRTSDICPVCKSSYRQRFQVLYFDEHIQFKEKRVLHIAPEFSLHTYILSKTDNYVCGDIEPERYAYYSKPIKTDLTELPFTKNSFDIVICNHVLEHIPEDIQAMKEIFRVLKQDGISFLQVPISLKLKETFEDSSIVTPEERLQQFGQKDHVRVYAMDYVKRLQRVGFRVKVVPASDYAHHPYYNKLMLDAREMLFICEKQNKK
jgi:SAM-dependent methyltransferase